MNKIRKIGEVGVAMFLALILSLTLGAAYSGSAAPSQSAPAAAVQAVGASDAQEVQLAESLAYYSGPYDCSSLLINSWNAWPGGTVVCSKGTGTYRSRVTFRSWLSGAYYARVGPCVKIGRASLALSLSKTDPAVSVYKVNC